MPESSGAAADITPEIHKRDVEVVTPAGEQLFAFATQWKVDNKLTDNEVSYIISVLLNRHIQVLCLKERENTK
jgi:hypothetical protein